MTLKNRYNSAMGKISVSSSMEERILKNLANEETRNKDINEKVLYKKTNRKSYLNWIKPVSSAAACCAAALLIVFVYSASMKNPTNVNQIKGSQLPSTVGEVKTKQTIQRSKATDKTITAKSEVKKNKPEANIIASIPKIYKTQQNEKNTRTNNSGVPSFTQDSQQQGQTAVNNPIVMVNDIASLKNMVSFELEVPIELPSGYNIENISVISGKLVQINYSNGNDKIIFRTASGTEDISGDYTAYETSEITNTGDLQINLKGNKSLINLAAWTQNGVSFSLSFSNGMEKEAVMSIIENMKKI